MNRTALFFLLTMMPLLLISCATEIKKEDLYGKWSYTRVQNFNPADSLSKAELQREKPAIIFSADSNLLIEWGGKKLSYGTYRMDGKMIRYTEVLDGGRKRSFPFLIKEMEENKLIFETMEQNPTRVTAVRD